MGGDLGDSTFLEGRFSVSQSLQRRDVGISDCRGASDAAGGGSVGGIPCRAVGASDMNHRDKQAGSPHRFVSRVELREALGKRAMDEQRLPELIEEVLVDSL